MRVSFCRVFIVFCQVTRFLDRVLIWIPALCRRIAYLLCFSACFSRLSLAAPCGPSGRCRTFTAISSTPKELACPDTSGCETASNPRSESSFTKAKAASLRSEFSSGCELGISVLYATITPVADGRILRAEQGVGSGPLCIICTCETDPSICQFAAHSAVLMSAVKLAASSSFCGYMKYAPLPTNILRASPMSLISRSLSLRHSTLSSISTRARRSCSIFSVNLRSFALSRLSDASISTRLDRLTPMAVITKNAATSPAADSMRIFQVSQNSAFLLRSPTSWVKRCISESVELLVETFSPLELVFIFILLSVQIPIAIMAHRTIKEIKRR
jgi:hypothetical protein